MVKRLHSSRKIQDHIVQEGSLKATTEVGGAVKNVGWDVKEAEIHADPIEDSGTGAAAIIRTFYFKLPPKLPEVPGKEELLDWHKKHTVIPTLWKDELTLIQEPRIVMGKKGAFTIFAVCGPATRLGVKSAVHERPELVQNIINAASNNPN